jgi:hypothetical protein
LRRSGGTTTELVGGLFQGYGNCDKLRIPEKYQNYRYARISQHFYGLKNL